MGEDTFTGSEEYASGANRVPHNLGEANHGSLKAAAWLIRYKVYYTIALTPLWTRPDADVGTTEDQTCITLLLQLTTLLLEITQFLTVPAIKVKDLKELVDLKVMARRTKPAEPTPNSALL
ncbi:hypothetical protein PSTG_04123 [Puccinia striiformis f. sp. tritici PST-78]|uniref:Uncharacterized protein n=1 Tax=Puccinia striiformis f. sp. tritici PST-78 TaxID=1165861 RepID=A0A0L0VU73_9BASI|nr:hypothetical protein PSTG_04123 [Puccinia striiformis f. sp. tritici PST-78]